MKKEEKITQSRTIKQKPATEKEEPKEIATKNARCTFCRRLPNSSRLLIAGPNNVYICESCVETAVSIMIEVSPIDWIHRLTKLIAKKPETKVVPMKKSKEPRKGARKT